jgi:hypothetical protein
MDAVSNVSHPVYESCHFSSNNLPFSKIESPGFVGFDVVDSERVPVAYMVLMG